MAALSSIRTNPQPILITEPQVKACKDALSKVFEDTRQNLAEVNAKITVFDSQIKIRSIEIEKLRLEIHQLREKEAIFSKDAALWKAAKKECADNDVSSLEALHRLTGARKQGASENYEWDANILESSLPQLQKMLDICKRINGLPDAWRNFDKNLLPAKEKTLVKLEGEVKESTVEVAKIEATRKALEQTAQRIHDVVQAFQNNFNSRLSDEVIATGKMTFENRVHQLDADLATFTTEMHAWDNSPKILAIKKLLLILAERAEVEKIKLATDAELKSTVDVIAKVRSQIASIETDIKRQQTLLDQHKKTMMLSFSEIAMTYDPSTDQNYQRLLLLLNTNRDKLKENRNEEATLAQKQVLLSAKATTSAQALAKLNSEIATLSSQNISEKGIAEYRLKSEENKKVQGDFDFKMNALVAGIAALEEIKTLQTIPSAQKKENSSPTGIALVTENGSPKAVGAFLVNLPKKKHGMKRKSEESEAQLKTHNEASPVSTDVNKSRKANGGAAASDNRDLTQVMPHVPGFPKGSLHELIGGSCDLNTIKAHIATNPRYDEAINGWTPMLLLALRSDIGTFTGFIDQYKPNLKAKTTDGFNALQLCCFNPLMNDATTFGKVIETLTEELDVNEPKERPPLHIAVAKMHKQMVAVLNELGGSVIEPSVQDRAGMTAGHYAVMNKDDESLGHIIDMKKFNHFAKSKGKTVLEFAESDFPNSAHLATMKKRNLNRSLFTPPPLGVVNNPHNRRKK